jgi:copper(I)-binding protein
MPEFRRVILAVLGLLLASPAVAPAALAEDGIAIERAWARATPGKASSAVVYLTLRNTGAGADRLVAVSTPAAAKAGLHETRMDSGVMKMRPLPVLDIAPGEAIELKPGATHLMLTELKRPLKEGDRFPLTLTFEKGGTKEVEVAVEKAGAMTGGMAGHDVSGHDNNMGGMGGHAGMPMPMKKP